MHSSLTFFNDACFSFAKLYYTLLFSSNWKYQGQWRNTDRGTTERLCLDTASAAANWQQKHKTFLTASEPPLGLDVPAGSHSCHRSCRPAALASCNVTSPGSSDVSVASDLCSWSTAVSQPELLLCDASAEKQLSLARLEQTPVKNDSCLDVLCSVAGAGSQCSLHTHSQRNANSHL